MMIDFAKEELDRLGDDPMQKEMNKGILEVVRVFAAEGHSGFSARYAIDIIEKLVRYEPLTPLTGKKDEWEKIAEGVYQNRRCPRIFMERGKAYDIDGKIFRDPSGATFTNYDSRVDVVFPYTPKSEIVDVMEY